MALLIAIVSTLMTIFTFTRSQPTCTYCVGDEILSLDGWVGYYLDAIGVQLTPPWYPEYEVWFAPCADGWICDDTLSQAVSFQPNSLQSPCQWLASWDGGVQQPAVGPQPEIGYTWAFEYFDPDFNLIVYLNCAEEYPAFSPRVRLDIMPYSPKWFLFQIDSECACYGNLGCSMSTTAEEARATCFNSNPDKNRSNDRRNQTRGVHEHAVIRKQLQKLMKEHGGTHEHYEFGSLQVLNETMATLMKT